LPLSHFATQRIVLVIALSLCVLTGCEALQRKLTRKPKHPRASPNPIISFQDYTRAMTPLDRYRKHHLMFDYWNSELIASLTAQPLNPKRTRRASTEALAELETLQGLMVDGVASRLRPFIEERARIHRQLQRGSVGETRATAVSRQLESQTRQIQRDFSWRDVEDQLKPQPAGEAATLQGVEADAPTP